MRDLVGRGMIGCTPVCDCDLCRKEQEWANRGLCYRCENGIPCHLAEHYGKRCPGVLDLIVKEIEEGCSS
jgi:hypothetical protein